MKKTFEILLGVILSFGCLTASGPAEYDGSAYARLSHVQGDVFVQRAEDLGYEEGAVNLALIRGDKLGTRDGRAEIHLGNRNYLRIDRFSQVDLADLPRDGRASAGIHLLSGRIFLRINQLDREKDYEVHTPDASFYLMDIGLYSIEVKESGESEFQSLEGAAEAAGETGSVVVEEGEMVVASEGRFIIGPEYVAGDYGDAFDEWNRARDTFHNRAVARSYLPDELRAYESELDYYGNWSYESSYGYVWVPRVYHSSWRPYWNGRWVWYPIIGWTWVSNEPWGWCVTHYGRWHWGASLGWYWIPTRHWGPAWVHWYRGGDYFGWSPLSYHGHPGLVINNRYYGRNNHRFSPWRSRSLVVVHKNQLQARRISRVALGRSQVGRLGKVSLRSGSPDIRPVVSRTSSTALKASRAMARTDVRRVRKFDSPGGALRTENRMSPRRGSSPSLSGTNSSRLNRSPSGATSPSSRAGSARTSRVRSPSSRSARTRDISSRSARSSASSGGGIRTYPSRRISPERSSVSGRAGRATSSSSTGSVRSGVSGRTARTYSSRLDSSRGSGRTSVRSYPSSSRSSARSVRSSGTRTSPRSSVSRSRSSSSSSSRGSGRTSVRSYSSSSRSSARSVRPSGTRTSPRSSVSRSGSSSRGSSVRSRSTASRSSSRGSSRGRSVSSSRSSKSSSRKSGSARTSSSRSRSKKK